MCDRWRDNFAAFLKDMGERPAGHTLDRINNNGPYSPENCRWVTMKENQRNKRDNHHVTAQGITQTTSAWSEANKIPSSTIHSRLTRGWSPERAVTEPIGTAGPGHPLILTLDGITRTLPEWSQVLGLRMVTIHVRLRRGWPVERVLTQPVRRSVDGHYV